MAEGSSTDQKLMVMGKTRSLAFAVKIQAGQISQSIYWVCSSQTGFFPSQQHDQKLAIHWSFAEVADRQKHLKTFHIARQKSVLSRCGLVLFFPLRRKKPSIFKLFQLAAFSNSILTNYFTTQCSVLPSAFLSWVLKPLWRSFLEAWEAYKL